MHSGWVTYLITEKKAELSFGQSEMRKPFQGVLNIIRFNWPFYVLSLGLILFMFAIRNYSTGAIAIAAVVLLIGVICLTVISLLVSWYVYDLSRFYEFSWLEGLPRKSAEKIVNINAGFDETSSLLANKFEHAEMTVCDFMIRQSTPRLRSGERGRHTRRFLEPELYRRAKFP